MSGARGDDFTRRKLLWLDQVAGDLAVPDGAFRLAFVIASKYLNRKTGDAYPSQTTLAGMLGVKTSKGIKYLVDHLVSCGHLDVTEAHGRGLTNRYRPILRSTTAAPHKAADATGQTLFPELDEAADVPSGVASDRLDFEFEEFWQQYPRKVDRAAARKAYARQREAGAAAAVILAGVLRYAGERDGQDPKYTKHAATWLNRQCWNDEPLAGRGDRGRGPQTSAPQPSHLETALGGMRRDG